MQAIKRRAIELLTLREHSQFELQQKLLAKGFAVSNIAQVVNELSAQKLQSDQRFAEAFIRSRQNHGFGPLRIEVELKQRKVAEEAVSQAMSEQNDAKWLEIAVKIRVKKFGSNLPKNTTDRVKQSRFLQYKGFNSEQIKNVLNMSNENGY